VLEKRSAHYRDFYPCHNRPAESTIRRLVAKFESTDSINNQPTSVRHRNARSAENIAAVRVYGKIRGGQFLVVHKNLAFLRLQLGEFCVDLGLHPYKIQLTQELKVNDHRQRHVFADWVLEQLKVNPNFAKQIIFSDEAHF